MDSPVKLADCTAYSGKLRAVDEVWMPEIACKSAFQLTAGAIVKLVAPLRFLFAARAIEGSSKKVQYLQRSTALGEGSPDLALDGASISAVVRGSAACVEAAALLCCAWAERRARVEVSLKRATKGERTDWPAMLAEQPHPSCRTMSPAENHVCNVSSYQQRAHELRH
jgi:hypothetical protein